MLAKVHPGAVCGVDAYPVEIEVNTGRGDPQTVIVGLPDAAVKESPSTGSGSSTRTGSTLPPSFCWLFETCSATFKTAINVGYGDFHPCKRLSKGIAILTALVGIIFTGIVVAVALHAAQTAFKEYI